MICALVQDNVVVKVTTLVSEEEYQVESRGYSNAIDITNANPMPAVGWVFNGNTLVPGEGQTAVTVKRITKLGMRQRFTFSELCGLTGAAMTSPPTATSTAINVLLGNLNVATYIDLARADTVGGMNLLVSVGLLTADRAAAILTAPIQDYERYKGTE